jgi:hypothetical protein
MPIGAHCHHLLLIYPAFAVERQQNKPRVLRIVTIPALAAIWLLAQSASTGIPQMTAFGRLRLAQFGLFGSGELWVKIRIPWSAPLRRPTVSARGGDDFILRIFRSGIALAFRFDWQLLNGTPWYEPSRFGSDELVIVIARSGRLERRLLGATQSR